ncbi:hypothetical protein D3C85_1683310 [compost metagenome]
MTFKVKASGRGALISFNNNSIRMKSVVEEKLNSAAWVPAAPTMTTENTQIFQARDFFMTRPRKMKAAAYLLQPTARGSNKVQNVAGNRHQSGDGRTRVL